MASRLPARAFAELPPINRKIAKATARLGVVVQVMCRMWVKMSMPVTAGARLVVSESGDILSPK